MTGTYHYDVLAFETDKLATLCEAFDATIRRLSKGVGDPSRTIQQRVAVEILKASMGGECDARRLSDKAIEAISRHDDGCPWLPDGYLLRGMSETRN